MSLHVNNGDSNPFSIGFDAKRAFFNKSGLGNYSRNLLLSLVKHYPENSYYLFTPETKKRIVLENEDKFILIEPKMKFPGLTGPLWRRKFMNKDIKRQKLDIFHGLSHELPVGIENTGVKSVVTVHDLIFIRFPEFYNRIDAKIYYRKLIHSCRVSDRIIAISEQTRSDLMTFLKVPSDKISVIRQGCNPYFREKFSVEVQQSIRAKYNLPGKYLLYVGTIEERKNLLNIVKAIHIRKINIPLVVVGRKMDSYYKKVQSYIVNNKVSNILFPEQIPNFELPVIYQNAHCFIYPSLFEGFGIPVLEALVSGTPVITSKGGCFSEAGGPGSIYVDPSNSEEIGDAIQMLTDDKELRDKMITRGYEYASNFRDEVITGEHMKLYHSLLK